MKKFLAFALVAMMVMAMVPASLAAPAKDASSFDREAHKADAPFSQKAVDNDGNVVTVENATSKTVSTSNVSNKYSSIKSSDLQTKGWMADTARSGLQMMEQEDSLLSGYWLEQDRFTLVNDWFTDGSEVYTQVIQPIDESGEYHEFMKGETFFMNYQLMKAWDSGSMTLKPLDKDVNVYYYVYAGTKEDFSGEGGNGIIMRNAWQTGDSKMGMRMIAPEDNYVYMFVVVVADTTIPEFGAWVAPSFAEVENEFKAIESGAEMKVGQAVTTDTRKSKLVLMPAGNDYRLAYGEKHKIELEGGKHYVAMFDSSDSIGLYVYFCDENMDIINSTFLGSGALQQGHTYKDAALVVMPAVTGTYYIVTCGFYMGDKGEIEATVYNWNDVAAPLTNTTSSVNLDALGTDQQVGPETGLASTPYAWFYIWYPDYSMGELVFLYPGTYTVAGSNANVFVDIYDGVNLVLKDATVGSTWAANTYAPATITSTGKKSAIENSSLDYSFYNYEGCNAGTYFLGDTFTVTSSGKSQGAIYTDNAPMHILAKKLEVFSSPHEGTYPIGIWTTGKHIPNLTLGGQAQFADGNRKSIMYFDGEGHNLFGYTVSQHEELFRLHNQPNLNEAALEFSLTTNGQLPEGGDIVVPDPNPNPDPNKTVLGDANEDGNVNTGDATMILKHAASMLTLQGQGLANADVNQDGNVNTGDATMVLKIAANIIPNPNN